jgi:hypothetical protein
MTEDEYALVSEVLKDAEGHHRLSQWEEEFCNDMRARLLTQKANLQVSDKQMIVIRRIEEKIYR